MILVTDSTSVHSYEYDEATRTFSLAFKSKPEVIYDYPDFPREAYESFLEAESKGKWVFQVIRSDWWQPGGFKAVRREAAT
jgi:hypothetical protein